MCHRIILFSSIISASSDHFMVISFRHLFQYVEYVFDILSRYQLGWPMCGMYYYYAHKSTFVMSVQRTWRDCYNCWGQMAHKTCLLNFTLIPLCSKAFTFKWMLWLSFLLTCFFRIDFKTSFSVGKISKNCLPPVAVWVCVNA